MQSVAHNGFGCPYCRTKMAEEPEEEESDYGDEEEEEMFDDDALRGFRFFWNNVNGEEHDEDDDADEQQLEEWEDIEDDEEEAPTIPNANFVAEKLRLHNVSYEDLVKILLLRDHEEYQEQEDEEQVERLDGEVFGKMRIIISNYEPQQAIPTRVEPEVVQIVRNVDLEAQPKTTQVRRVPSFMVHV
jgi:hypothetical protein